ncbi:tRNA guanosine(34) transglycosylase Tgt [Prosthecobacter vanneervenii]|uniref:Queuine tRNA-ribosyltransferase n=1 Tax=Prosthecobacter vanneervenii TaxID=48466 RepID=A0A7W8DIH1_9BACT|nr:tRNA guanosine(34) transglycosylase Tgt [Prosthecobacter vanneervenii]MBB5030935.1 queuine tRNA-ribosyltransferase [Prosthecobacter vanneervenii]
MSPSRLQFQLDAQASGSRARATTFHTLHGTIRSPLFMPVGTQATVKAQTQESLHESGSQILLANTYHLLLRPGPDVFSKLGGIHKFMKWPGSVLTDSGGYQIFSLPHSREMTEKGAVFQSYVDGQRILLSPELSIQTQRAIGSDIMMVLDQCIPSTADEKAARAALQITQRWAVRSLAAREDSPQSMFGIVQGALYPQLRRESAEGLMQLDFDGFAIGGLAVGEEKQEREDVCELTAALLPADRPRYLMGVGTPLDVLEAVHRGVDMFDCIIPTQVAKRGTAFTSRGIVELRRSVYKFSEAPLDPACTCPVCSTHTRAYLHHLTKTQEPLGWTLVGQHNIHFYHQLMREVRQSILEDRFLPLYHHWREILPIEDIDHPVTHPKRTSTKVEMVGDYELCGDPPAIRHRISTRTVCTTPQLDATTESQIVQHLRQPADSPPLVVWDTHLDAAATALAVILLYEAEAAKGHVRPLHLVSFSDDLSPLRLALHHKRHFPYLRHGAADTLIRRDVWESRYCIGLKWTLVHGAAVDAQAPAADVLLPRA